MAEHHSITAEVEAERIEGAKACMRALANLVKSAEAFNDEDEGGMTYTEKGEHYYGSRQSAAKVLANAIGPLNPYQEGVIIAMAEFIHSSVTTGEPDLERWTPCAAMTAGQYRSVVEDMVRDMEEDDA